MIPVPATSSDRAVPVAQVRGNALADLPEEIAGPLLAGMRARAFADSCESLGLAAMLVDRKGMVLFATRAALLEMGRALHIVSGHLCAADGSGNEMAAAFMGDALLAVGEGRIHLGKAAKLSLAAVPFGDSSPFQCLHAVILVGAGLDASLPRLRSILP